MGKEPSASNSCLEFFGLPHADILSGPEGKMVMLGSW